MKCKVLPHHLVAQRLLDGQPHSPAEIKASFANDPRMSQLMHRLPTYIWDIRQIGGNIKAVQEGRNVVSYQLRNVTSFNVLGQLVKNARGRDGKLMKTVQKGVVEDRATVKAA